MKNLRLLMLALIIWLATGAHGWSGESQSASEITSLLTTGQWHFSPRNTRTLRTFKPDGTFSSSNGATGTWKITGDQLEIIFLDNTRHRFSLPVDPTGMRGTDNGGRLETLARVAPQTAVASSAQNTPGAAPVTPGGPNAAQNANVTADWQKKAVSEFPELADAKSDFNHKFITKVSELKSSTSGFFNDPRWPYLIAQGVSKAQETAPGYVPALLRKALAAAEDSNKPVMDQLLLQAAKLSPHEPAIDAIRKASSDLASAQATINQLTQAAGASKADAARLRQNAKNIDQPNPLNPRDTSYKQRVEQMRKQADQIEKQMQDSLRAANDQVKSAQAELSGISLPESSRSPAGATVKRNSNSKSRNEENDSLAKAIADAKAHDPDWAKQEATEKELIQRLASLPPVDGELVGPKIKGVRLGMDIRNARDAMVAAFPDSELQPQEIAPISNGNEGAVYKCSLFGKYGGTTSFTSGIVADAKGKVIAIRFDGPMGVTDIAFKSNGMSAKDFVQQFINSYNIPKIDADDSGEGWSCITDDGAKVIVTVHKDVLLQRAPSISERQQNFN